MEKKRVNLYLSDSTKRELDKQCQEVGMDMSNYFTYLILKEKERGEQQNRLDLLMNKMLPNGLSDVATLAQLIKNKGDE